MQTYFTKGCGLFVFLKILKSEYNSGTKKMLYLDPVVNHFLNEIPYQIVAEFEFFNGKSFAKLF